MGSHYLFFRPEHGIHFIDAFRPRQRPNQKTKSFDFNQRFEDRYKPLAFFVMTDGQRQRIRGEFRDAVQDKPGESRPAIYAVSNMVTANLVDFTSKKIEEGVRTFRADFYSPVRREWFAYASPYGSGKFKHQMKEHRCIDLEMVRFLDYKIGGSVESAIKSTFSTFDLAVLHNSAFQKYQGRGLALIVPAKLIDRE